MADIESWDNQFVLFFYVSLFNDLLKMFDFVRCVFVVFVVVGRFVNEVVNFRYGYWVLQDRMVGVFDIFGKFNGGFMFQLIDMQGDRSIIQDMIGIMEKDFYFIVYGKLVIIVMFFEEILCLFCIFGCI